MYRIVTALAVLPIILSFFAQLETVALDSTAQIEHFTQQINDAIPCATQGIDLSRCGVDFRQDSQELENTLTEYEKLLEDSQKELSAHLNATQSQ